MKISHESPICLLKISRLYNDYDYALVHLFEQSKEYYKFFEESLSLGRTVILDNSIFELGTAFDSELFHDWILKLHPTYYIVPDVFDNYEATISSANSWRKLYGRNVGECKEILVCQGETREDFFNCYKTLCSMDPDMIAFPVNSKSYLDGQEYTPQKMAEGRFQVIMQCIIYKRLHNIKMKHHLLGVSVPQEVALYKDVKEIVSVDTSNPVLHGMEEIWYNEDGKLSIKSHNKMHELMNYQCTPIMMDAITYNIMKFRSHVN